MKRVLLIGNPRPTHVGGHLLRAADEAGVRVELMDMEHGFAGPRWMKRLYWHLLGHRPVRLNRFGAEVLRRCRVLRPDLVLATGIAPLSAGVLNEVKAMGMPAANFLTDDPWNSAHRAPWFMRALRAYTHVFTPRHANEPDLRALAGPDISYLPFGYAPGEHGPAGAGAAEGGQWADKVVFIGGADADRAEVVRALVKAGLPVALWGGYWEKHADLAPLANGHADAETCRRIAGNAGANLCLVRMANRDGHSMRSYELAAAGAVMLVEDTEDHRELFGADGEAARYFSSPETMCAAARELLQLEPGPRERLRRAAREKVTGAPNTYADRLRAILAKVFHPPA